MGCDEVAGRRGRLQHGVVVGFCGNVNVEVKVEAGAIVVVE